MTFCGSRFACLGKRLGVVLLWASLAVHVGCGGVTGPVSPPNGGDTNASQGFIYSGNGGSSDVSGFSVNNQNGAVAAITGSPFSVATLPVSIATSGNFVFVSSSGDINATNPENYRITTFRIDPSTGALSQVAALTYPGTVGEGAPTELKIDPAGKFMYIVLGGAGGLATFSIDAGTGALTELAGSPIQPVGFGVLRHPAFTPDGRLMFMTGDIGPRAPLYAIVRFFRDPASGALDPNFLEMRADGLITSMATTPDGLHLLAAVPQYPINNGGALAALDSVSVYTIGSDGSLTAVPNEPFPTGSAPQAVAVDPSGKLAVVANHDSQDVSVMSINSDGGLSPVAGSPFPAGTGPTAIAISTSGEYVFVANEGSNDISGYRLDSTGKLTPLAGSPYKTGANPTSIVAAKF